MTRRAKTPRPRTSAKKQRTGLIALVNQDARTLPRDAPQGYNMFVLCALTSLKAQIDGPRQGSWRSFAASKVRRYRFGGCSLNVGCLDA